MLRIHSPPHEKSQELLRGSCLAGSISDHTNTNHIASLSQRQLDWLLANGIGVTALIRPVPIMSIRGEKVDDQFVHDPGGDPWLAFEEPNGDIFWNPRSGDLVSDFRAFCLGEDAMNEPVSYGFDNRALNIFSAPLNWLRHSRQGIVVMRWELAFDMLRDVPRIVVDEEIVATYNKAMRPARMPQVSVRRTRRKAAA